MIRTRLIGRTERNPDDCRTCGQVAHITFNFRRGTGQALELSFCRVCLKQLKSLIEEVEADV